MTDSNDDYTKAMTEAMRVAHETNRKLHQQLEAARSELKNCGVEIDRYMRERDEAKAEIERLKVRATEKSEMIRELLREQKDFVQETFNCRKLIGEQEKQLSEARAEIEKILEGRDE